MKRLPGLALSAAIFGFSAGASCLDAQEVLEPIETPKCSFVCALGGGVPAAPKPVAVPAEPAPAGSAITDLRRHARPAGGVKIIAAARVRAKHVAVKAMPSRPSPADAVTPVARPAPQPDAAAAVVDLRRAPVTSPVVQIESRYPAHSEAIVPRRAAERASDDLHLDTGHAAGDVEVSGFTRAVSSWDWLITQAHAATLKRPQPYGDLAGVRSAF